MLPNWLAGLTGADKFANNPANGFGATLGDMAQAAGHSMAQHYRGKGGTYGGTPLIPGENVSPDLAASLASIIPGARGPEIAGSALPPVNNPTSQPEPAPMSPQQISAITAGLNGGTPWGTTGPLPGAAGQIPLSLLLQMGLR